MNWKRSVIFSASFLALFFGDVLYTFSCGPQPDPYDYYTNFFNPALPADKGYEPFYYTALSEYYDAGPSEPAANIREWAAFFGGGVTAKDIRTFIYTYSRPQLAALYAHIEKGAALQLPDSVTGNTLTRWLISNRDRETLGYLMYAKQCEALVDHADPWTQPVFDSAAMARLASNGLQLYRACKDRRIKERYGFQVTRLRHYGRNYQGAIAGYDSLVAPLGAASLIHYRTLALKAGALLRLGSSAESAYLFSRVFEHAPSQRTIAYVNTGWANAAAADVMRYCHNDREKATVAAMYASRVADLHPDGLRQVYRLHPQAPMLQVLLTREINKLEDAYLFSVLGTDLNEAPIPLSFIEKPSPALVQETQQLLDSIAGGGKVREPAMWQIASAYLSFMLKDYTAARNRLAAVQQASLRPALRDQWQVVQLLVSINEQPRIDKAFEKKLLPSLQWLDTKLVPAKAGAGPEEDGGLADEPFYSRMYRNLLNYVIAPRYARQGDVVRKALILLKRDQANGYSLSGYNSVTGDNFVSDSLTPGQLQALYRLKHERRKTDYEKYLCGYLGLSDAMLEERVAISYLRVHDFANAKSWFAKGGSRRYSHLVFEPQLQDYGAIEPDADSTNPGISGEQFALRMLELEKRMKKDPADAKACFEYATGLFSISYYGHSYPLVADYRPTTRWYEKAHDDDPFLKEYYGCYRAEEYYRRAAEAATDPEFRARSLFMAARCAQKHMLPEEDGYWHTAAIGKNPYFSRLAGECAGTDFYREIKGQCGYLRDYVSLQQPARRQAQGK